ncbi:uncharacterized protein LOC124296779 [Neodiprion virginianus]|uniref:uncharacterized protein LOC124296779 n=1 Tax=Neodiprion virginianus TaxID=2961670 RepID=UPI001EE73986|nr:uncharacterized protein LOC124296779 [Neodiprion virginianus]XP_046603088.1 uncharacterized protein LOC124296779 [Neodiprion virginianus]
MDRTRVLDLSRPRLDSTNEVIDLTGDSPVMNSVQPRIMHTRSIMQRPLRTPLTYHLLRHLGTSESPPNMPRNMSNFEGHIPISQNNLEDLTRPPRDVINFQRRLLPPQEPTSLPRFMPQLHLYPSYTEGIYTPDDPFIQVIDPEEPQSAVNSIANEEEFRDINSSPPFEEYSTTVPCINDSSSGEQTVLSCPICFEPLCAQQKPMTTTCGHIFCAMCLKKTLHGSRNKTCPKCNAPVKIKSCIRLYF